MSNVMVGSARADEYGKSGWQGTANAGDQTGKEVSTQAWYKHSLGWYVLRPKSRSVGRKISQAMRAACANDNIGYDQSQRDSLYNWAKNVNFNPELVTEKVECDCSSLVRVCVAYAGIMTANFRTATECNALLNTGEFDRLTAAKYCEKSDYLMAGDILVTRQSGHTVVVLNDGDKAAPDEGQLKVDGYFGKLTCKATQKYFRTVQDGVISSQPKENKRFWYCDDGAFEWTTGRAYGSTCIYAWTKWLNEKGELLPLSRIASVAFVKALQRVLTKEGLYSGKIDGSAGRETCKAWQRYLNSLH